MAPASAQDEPPSTAVVQAFDETSGPAAPHGRIETERWAALAAAVLQAEGVSEGELGLRFVDPGVMAELNLDHMGVRGATDVLAFPIDGSNGREPAIEPAVLLGDVVVCPAYAAQQAGRGSLAEPDKDPTPDSLTRPDKHPTPDSIAEPDKHPTPDSIADELALLVVHGVLHVLGYDHAHDTEAAIMRAREGQLLAAHHRQP